MKKEEKIFSKGVRKKNKRVKSKISCYNFLPENHKGQVTIFIILAIAIIAVGVLLYLFYPQVKSFLRPESKNPNTFLQTCLEDELEDTVEILSMQGGSMEPENFYLYKDYPLEYLCYSSENYKPCVIQQPMLKSHIESEIGEEIAEEVEACLGDLKDSFEKSGYTVNLENGETIVELLPETIVATLTNKLTLTKGDTERYDSFKITLENNLYELVGIANSIIDWEAKYGDVDTTTYMSYYHGLKVEKWNQQDGSTTYVLTDKKTNNKFQFASRSIAWPM